MPQDRPSEDHDGERGQRAHRPAVALVLGGGFANGEHQRRRKQRRGHRPSPRADACREQQIPAPVFTPQHEGEARRRQHHHHRAERAGQYGSGDAQRRARVIPGPPGFDGARQEENHQRQERQCGDGRRVVPDRHRVPTARVPNPVQRKLRVRRQKLRHRSERVGESGQETGCGGARQPPRHHEQRQRTQNVEHAGDAVKTDRHRHAAKRADGGGQRRNQRRIRPFEGNTEVPVGPPRGAKPTALGARGERGPEAVHGAHMRGRPEKHVAADVEVDPQQDQRTAART